MYEQRKLSEVKANYAHNPIQPKKQWKKAERNANPFVCGLGIRTCVCDEITDGRFSTYTKRIFIFEYTEFPFVFTSIENVGVHTGVFNMLYGIPLCILLRWWKKLHLLWLFNRETRLLRMNCFWNAVVISLQSEKLPSPLVNTVLSLTAA